MGRRDAKLEAINPFPYLLHELNFLEDSFPVQDDVGDFFLD